MRKYNIRRKNNIILGALAIVLITMAGGYAIFSSNLNITGTSNISNNWDIRISKVQGTLGGHAAHATDTNENEINPECDSTTSTPKSCGEGLSVTFSDLFYYEGDSSTYNITLKNSGSLDAALTQNVEPVVTTNSDKIHVELTGFKTKGQTLAKNDTQTTTLTITYASETALADSNNKIKPLSNTKTITPRLLDNEEEQPEVSITVTYPFVQDSESGAVTSEKHLVEYDCTTNGGTSCTNYKEYVTTGQSVNLENEGTQKSQYAFLGWNTDKDATEGLSTLTMGNNDIKLYAIYQRDRVTFNSVTTTSTTNSITVVASASALSEITKYEYSTDGENYYEGSIDTTNNNSTYTFTGLTQKETYPIYVKATAKSGVSDTYEVSGVDLTENTVTEGDGLYQDATETDRYIYKGANPNNYLTFNGETAGWRIVSVESDGTYKIIKTDSIGNMAWDAANTRSSSTSTYCGYASGDGCNAWAKTSALASSNTEFSNSLSNGIFYQYYPYGGNDVVTGTVSYNGTVTQDASLNTYLNSNTSGNYYYGIESTSKQYIDKHDFAVSTPGNSSDTEIVATNVEQEKIYTWNGYVGLITATDYMRASTNTACTSLNYANGNSGCGSNNWLKPTSGYSWTISPYVSYRNSNVYFVYSDGKLASDPAYDSSVSVRPVVFLKTDTVLKGSGTSGSPYYIGNAGVNTQTLGTPTFSEEETSTGKTITIDYHKECGSNGITCTYIKNGEATEILTGSTQTVDFTEDGTLVATISDGTNTVSTSSYTVKVASAERTISKLNTTVVTSGTGLYKDATETDRYIYKGSNPSNYIQFNGETWRIYSIESDGSLKITRSDLLSDTKQFDPNSSNSRLSSGYCSDSNAKNYGCNAWASTASLNNSVSSFVNGSLSGAVTDNSALNTYLNGTYYSSLSSTAQGQIVAHDWNVGPAGTYNDTYTLSQLVSSTYEGKYQWNGKIALLTKSEYMRASSSSSCVTAKYWYDNRSSTTCKGSDYLYNSSTHWWLLSPRSETSSSVFTAYTDGYVHNNSAYNSYGVRPALYLKNTLNFTGSGTNDSNIYKIS